MPELTLESLAARVAALEEKLAKRRAAEAMDGPFDGYAFMKQIEAEMAAEAEAGRETASDKPTIIGGE